jgi:O-antigen/teichoic acid export membrane protein
VADLVVRRGRWFALGSLGAALVCGVLGGPAMAAFALLAALFSFVFCMTTVCESILNAGRLRREVAVHRALQQVLNYGLAIGLIALWTSSALVAALGFCAGVAITAASEWRVLRARLWATSPDHRGAEAIAEWDTKVRAYARPYERWGGLQWLQTASDRWALLLASGVADAGLYAVVYQLGYTPLGLLATLLVQTIEPVAFSHAGDASAVERLARAQRLRRQTMALFGGMTLVAVLAAWLLHRVVFEAFIAPAYWPVSSLLPWMVLAAGLFGLGQMQAVKWLILVRPERMQTARTVLAAIGIGLIAAGAFLGGVTGVAIGQVLSSLLFFAGMAALR